MEDLKIKFVSIFDVVEQNTRSKAKCVQGVTVGDRIKIEMNLAPTRKYGGKGNYALLFDVYKQVGAKWEYVDTVTQNNLLKYYDKASDSGENYSVFTVDFVKLD